MNKLNERQRQAVKAYKTEVKNALDHRKDHLEHLAEALEKDSKGSKAGVIRNLFQREEQRCIFSKIAFIFQKNQNLHTTHIIVTDSQGNKTNVTEKEKWKNASLMKIEVNTIKWKIHVLTLPYESSFWRIWRRASFRSGPKWYL
jgi:hypothetical protein